LTIFYRNEDDFDGMVSAHKVAVDGDKSNIMNVLPSEE
jgi:hypothetical protein